MIDFNEIEVDIKNYLKIRYNNRVTIDLYSLRLMDLFKYYPATLPLELTEKEINNYIRVLVNRKSSFSYVSQFIQAAEYYYNHINKKSYIFNRKILPPKIETKVEILDQKDIFLMIDNFSNKKHKALFTLIYSCCLELSELLSIRLSDINTKKYPFYAKIRDTNDEIKRQCYISNRVKHVLAEYWKSCNSKPEMFLFEGDFKGKKYSKTSARNIVKNTFKDNGFSCSSEIKVLRISYMKHMVELGMPIINVLDNLGIWNFETIKKYTNIIHGELKIDFTPLDKIIGNPKISEPEIESLESVIFSLKSEEVQEYLLEALQCFRAGALRAGIVFTWSACIRFLQKKCITKGFPEINKALTKMKSPKKVKKLSDFEVIKEMNLLAIAFELKIISKHERKELENNLDLRNHCGHPSVYKPEINKAKAFIEDIVNLLKKNEP